MNFGNPTTLRVGMSGRIFGASYRVVGRVVMGVNEGGTTYYWQEYNLETITGEVATLVFERTESGGQWRWFKRFEPKNPFTAADAETKRVGDTVLIDHQNVHITRRDVSQVHFIEGKAPDGVFVGELAQYFNAGSGGGMIVASWIGDQIEFFRGMNVSTGMVRAAFNLPVFALRDFTLSGGAWNSWSRLMPQLMIPAFIAFFFFVIMANSVPAKRAPAVIKTAAVPSPLKVGSAGVLNGKNYHVAGHDLVKISEVGFQFERHEYQLQDDGSNTALLVFGTKPGSKDWVLFTPLNPVTPMTSVQAGAVHLGQSVNVDGIEVPATELFLSSARRASDSPPPGEDFTKLLMKNGVASADLLAGETNFCFTGRSGKAFLLVRWNQSFINFFRGTPLAETEVMKLN